MGVGLDLSAQREAVSDCVFLPREDGRRRGKEGGTGKGTGDVPCPLGSLVVVLPVLLLLLLLLFVYKVSRCSSSGMYKRERAN